MRTLGTSSKATLSSRGQIVIPKILREQFGIHAGSELIFNPRSDGVIEIQTTKRSIEMFFGRCNKSKLGKKSLSIKEMDEAILKAVSENNA